MVPKIGDLVCFDIDKLNKEQIKTFNTKGVWLLISISSFLPGIVTVLAGDQQYYIKLKYLKQYEPETD